MNKPGNPDPWLLDQVLAKSRRQEKLTVGNIRSSPGL